jgi:hypothetical protein
MECLRPWPSHRLCCQVRQTVARAEQPRYRVLSAGLQQPSTYCAVNCGRPSRKGRRRQSRAEQTEHGGSGLAVGTVRRRLADVESIASSSIWRSVLSAWFTAANLRGLTALCARRGGVQDAKVEIPSGERAPVTSGSLWRSFVSA